MNNRKIKILSNGNFFLPGVGFINGPVLSPYRENDANIFKMLGNGVHIVEVKADGSEKRLTLSNFKTGDAKKPVEKKEEVKPNPNVVSIAVDPPKQEEPVVEPEVKEEVTSEVHVVEDTVVETQPEVKEEVTSEVVEEQLSENRDNQYKYNKNKNKKHN